MKQQQNESPIANSLSIVFGDKQVSGTPDDLLFLTKELDEKSEQKPLLYQACGTEDFLYEENVTFEEVCKNTSLDVTTTFDPRTHEWGYWDHHIQKVLEWLPLKK